MSKQQGNIWKRTPNPLKDLKKTRANAGMNQSEFWSKIGMTQSAGSRYETGRKPPEPVALLIEITYGAAPEKALKKLGVDRPAA